MQQKFSDMDTAFQLIFQGVDKGILHLYDEGENLGDNQLRLLYQLLLRAAVLRKSRVYLDFTATTEKKKLNARPKDIHA